VENCSTVWNTPTYPRALAPNYEDVWKNGDKDPVIRKAGIRSRQVNFTVQPFTPSVKSLPLLHTGQKSGQTHSFVTICSLRYCTDYLIVLENTNMSWRNLLCRCNNAQRHILFLSVVCHKEKISLNSLFSIKIYRIGSLLRASVKRETDINWVTRNLNVT
jgi:hypothetical protein